MTPRTPWAITRILDNTWRLYTSAGSGGKLMRMCAEASPEMRQALENRPTPEMTAAERREWLYHKLRDMRSALAAWHHQMRHLSSDMSVPGKRTYTAKEIAVIDGQWRATDANLYIALSRAEESLPYLDDPSEPQVAAEPGRDLSRTVSPEPTSVPAGLPLALVDTTASEVDYPALPADSVAAKSGRDLSRTVSPESTSVPAGLPPAQVDTTASETPASSADFAGLGPISSSPSGTHLWHADTLHSREALGGWNDQSKMSTENSDKRTAAVGDTRARRASTIAREHPYSVDSSPGTLSRPMWLPDPSVKNAITVKLELESPLDPIALGLSIIANPLLHGVSRWDSESNEDTSDPGSDVCKPRGFPVRQELSRHVVYQGDEGMTWMWLFEYEPMQCSSILGYAQWQRLGGSVPRQPRNRFSVGHIMVDESDCRVLGGWLDRVARFEIS